MILKIKSSEKYNQKFEQVLGLNRPRKKSQEISLTTISKFSPKSYFYSILLFLMVNYVYSFSLSCLSPFVEQLIYKMGYKIVTSSCSKTIFAIVVVVVRLFRIGCEYNLTLDSFFLCFIKNALTNFLKKYFSKKSFIKNQNVPYFHLAAISKHGFQVFSLLTTSFDFEMKI